MLPDLSGISELLEMLEIKSLCKVTVKMMCKERLWNIMEFLWFWVAIEHNSYRF